MSEPFCYPSLSDLEYAWSHQKEERVATFRCRGMNDVAFEKLHTLMENDLFGSITCIDLSYNSLTNKSVPALYSLTQRQKPIKVLATHNRFDVERLSRQELKEFITRTIEQPLLMQTTLSIIGNPITNDDRFSISQIKDDDLRNTVILTQNQVQKTSMTVENLTKNVEKLAVRVGEQQKQIDKMFKSFEQKIITTLIDHYEGYKPIPSFELGLDNYQTDILLISPDRETVLIGEVKHELTDKAFQQIKARRGALQELMKDDEPPESLKNIKTIICAVGAEIIPNEQFRNKCKKDKIVLVEPNGERYKITQHNEI
jgi:hypothetical protein